MNPKHLHTPVSTRARCPVCQQPVYSRAGIHPQCAVRQSEPPRPKTDRNVPKPIETSTPNSEPGDAEPVGSSSRTVRPGSVPVSR